VLNRRQKFLGNLTDKQQKVSTALAGKRILAQPRRVKIFFARSRLPATAGLLCMGLFSVFWLGARARLAPAWPQADLDALLIDQFRLQTIIISGDPCRWRRLSGRMTAKLWSILC
jgi:hypothetical protein